MRQILVKHSNQTGEVAKKIVGGAANVLSNISGEIKQGVGAK
jgi:hypothetical protein